jgi:hypothetical protein
MGSSLRWTPQGLQQPCIQVSKPSVNYVTKLLAVAGQGA